jgi:hypothetical protein
MLGSAAAGTPVLAVLAAALGCGGWLAVTASAPLLERLRAHHRR